ncbi:hypothetical protein C8R43DRAFT_1115843 [Mycena crocata]|nr:hypothetical protein C8R43DRAFT_1115843 [Mycena crocata]
MRLPLGTPSSAAVRLLVPGTCGKLSVTPRRLRLGMLAYPDVWLVLVFADKGGSRTDFVCCEVSAGSITFASSFPRSP